MISKEDQLSILENMRKSDVDFDIAANIKTYIFTDIVQEMINCDIFERYIIRCDTKTTFNLFENIIEGANDFKILSGRHVISHKYMSTNNSDIINLLRLTLEHPENLIIVDTFKYLK